MFGIGYATAEDRLFFIDVLRHAGQGDLASFAGGANVAMDESVWASEPYTQQDLVNQVNYGLQHEPDGAQVYADITSYVNGINAYIRRPRSRSTRSRWSRPNTPPSGMPGGPQPFTHGEPRLDRDPGRRNLRQRRRHPALQRRPLREPRAPVRQRALRRGRVTPGDQPRLSRRRSTRSARSTTRRASPSAARGAGQRDGEPQAPPSQGQAPPQAQAHSASGQAVDLSGFATFLSFDDPNDPEAPTTVTRHQLPVPDAAHAVPRRWRRRSRCPTRIGRATSTTWSAGAAPSAPPRPARRAPVRAARRWRPSDRPRARPAGQRRSRAARVPALDVQRAAGQRHATAPAATRWP